MPTAGRIQPIDDWSILHSTDVIGAAQWLLGKVISTKINGKLTAGKIVETEAYQGPEDKAAHSYLGKRTKRTEVMFGQPGIAYVYLCYGIHNMLNVVTGPVNTPHAVLIRAIEPIEGIPHMLERRFFSKIKNNLTSGPGVLCKSLGIDRTHNSLPLFSGTSPIRIMQCTKSESFDIISSPRVGINYAEDRIKKPWRFRIANNPWTSPAK